MLHAGWAVLTQLGKSSVKDEMAVSADAPKSFRDLKTGVTTKNCRRAIKD